MDNPSLVVPGALQPLLDLTEVIGKVGVPQTTLDLVRLRVSEINGRVYTLAQDAEQADERLPLVKSWRTESCFADAERSALAMAEAVTLMTDPQDMASDEIWEDSSQYYNDEQLGALVMHIGLVNFWNRVNVATQQEPAAWR
ncbi:MULTISPECIES: carboxymuconolactone decarboxylase family protein [unclassified Streptomyces]|uniref:carboxymuconolactone decarboxylase family protein n=1 Tax=unclassified Streptomyces TaxID=2593676 RepID=UPI00224CC6E7|nr:MULTISPECIES: carboxymuconolactone decarboxylase family protein [unclassified Streptomyces]MCX4527188.1 carboxymuconolactone decarboxylase family protein [Streptomyces sp. NBC_01551]MCX4542236.1 carboxymuconolactone decarboxylase family protein [Streptomyces sp. NBC_01565]